MPSTLKNSGVSGFITSSTTAMTALEQAGRGRTQIAAHGVSGLNRRYGH
ncbi:MAG: hypothetical protein LBE74_03240 [Treponema sp.]|nr:hypothetical protein [Treponema sp.]